MSSRALARLQVKAGDQIPSIGLRATDGYLLNLRSFVGRQPVLLVFFGGPTLRGKARDRGVELATAMADGYERLRETGIEAVGVTCDAEEQQAAFVEEHRLPYLLYSDERRSAVEVLGIATTVSGGSNYNVARPIAFAVDAQGTIRNLWNDPDPTIIIDLAIRALSEPLPPARRST
jgi:thioredoxin-dependent peroxiredoxin